MGSGTYHCVGAVEGSPELNKSSGELRGGSTSTGCLARSSAQGLPHPGEPFSVAARLWPGSDSAACLFVPLGRALHWLHPSPAPSSGDSAPGSAGPLALRAGPGVLCSHSRGLPDSGRSQPSLGLTGLVLPFCILQMDTRSESQCSVAPKAVLNNGELVLPPRISRVNGWSLPLHYFQVVTWTVFLGLSSATFGIFIPLLPHVWKYVAYVVTGGIFSFHLVVHLIASCIDPADFNVRLMKNYSQPMPIFDRSKHAHVIQNQFCHLCKVTVNKKTKHCISCNKCVSGFDHHCNWINNCVGSRNY
ncbi:probable palmitoyltransferase ZDHHC11 isoform X3 [Trachypithecus francoisi]|nr:probable palmitoyltransferase ZDHHC11 isoform X2 [Trachypithecus francoisi]XP_033034575.1 probable palmitoyltransferase ZDHHC11 isoform X3 [Trachypithecus francoisi]